MNTRIRAIIALFLVSLFFITLIPDEASAFPYRIKGYLRDGDGNPIPGGNISITGEAYDIGIQGYVESTIWLSTDNTGFYEQAVENDPSFGGFIDGSVIISYNPLNGEEGVSESMEFNGLGSWVNLTYEEKVNAIDVLFSPVGLISIVVLVSTCLIGYYMYKSSKEDEDNTSETKRDVGRRRR